MVLKKLKREASIKFTRDEYITLASATFNYPISNLSFNDEQEQKLRRNSSDRSEKFVCFKPLKSVINRGDRGR